MPPGWPVVSLIRGNNFREIQFKHSNFHWRKCIWNFVCKLVTIFSQLQCVTAFKSYLYANMISPEGNIILMGGTFVGFCLWHFGFCQWAKKPNKVIISLQMQIVVGINSWWFCDGQANYKSLHYFFLQVYHGLVSPISCCSLNVADKQELLRLCSYFSLI